ncbi:MAG: AI-2E family transporter [Gordonia sp. (in: high G+C Gram-positive bacteria)]|uniref:AI-2E family transporter n=1 Tax=Gordonia sp. (in: high G+C Gram-positive bacteria) TaxID=84139 RepID=UPI0039E58EC0
MSTNDADRQTKVWTIREEDDAKVSPGVRATAAWVWRLLVIGVGIYVVGRLFREFEDIFVPVALALLFTALMYPAVDWLHNRGVPRVLAVVGLVLGAVVVVGLVVWFVINQFVAGAPELTKDFISTVHSSVDFLRKSSLHVDEQQIRQAGDKAVQWARENQGKIAQNGISAAGYVEKLLVGGALTAFMLIFFLLDGRDIWNFVTRVVPAGSRDHVRSAGRAGFVTLKSYVRATVAVALVDALVIGVGLVLLGIPLAVPLTVLIFLGSFIPVVGSFASGTVAVLVALATEGFVKALIVLALLVFVMMLEGHVLQPFLLGKSVKLHPAAVILAIAAGISLAGIVGGLLSIPLMAFLKTAFAWRPGDDEVPPPADPDTDPEPEDAPPEAAPA